MRNGGRAADGDTKTMKRNIRQTLFPLLAAMIWGAAFSAQSLCSAHLGPFTINALRFFIAFLVLLPVCLLRRRGGWGRWRDILLGSLCSGAALFAASNAQQFGLGSGASAGKAGFITALYIVLVPIAGVFTKKKSSVRLWLAVAVAVAGMYFLCISDGFSVALSDLCLLACAVLFTAQILAVDYFVRKVDGFVLSCGQFLVAALLSSIFLFTGETVTGEGLLACLWPLLYIAVFSSCVGYTLQILAQKDGNPVLVSLLLSLESFFAAVFGALLLHERLTGRELLGCGLMVAAIILAELPARTGGKGGKPVPPQAQEPMR